MKTYITTNFVYRIAYCVSRRSKCVTHAKKRYGFTPLEIVTGGKKSNSGALFLTGFTIVEVLLVVVIIALVAGLGGGLYAGTYKRMLVEKAARDLVLTAKYARIMAIEKQQPYEMRLDVANNGVSLVTSQWDEQNEQVQQLVVQDLFCRPVEFAEGVMFENIQIVPIDSEEMADTEQQQAVVFSPKGTAQSAIVQVGDGRNHYTVSVSAATGRAEMFYDTAENVTIGTIDLEAE